MGCPRFRPYGVRLACSFLPLPLCVSVSRPCSGHPTGCNLGKSLSDFMRTLGSPSDTPKNP